MSHGRALTGGVGLRRGEADVDDWLEVGVLDEREVDAEAGEAEVV
jgi:hypothetical protein